MQKVKEVAVAMNIDDMDKITSCICRMETSLLGKNDPAFKPSEDLIALPFMGALIIAFLTFIAYFITKYELDELLWMAGYAMAIVCGVNMMLNLGHLWTLRTSLKQFGYFLFVLFISASCFTLTFGAALVFLLLLAVLLLPGLLLLLLAGAGSGGSYSGSGKSRHYSSGVYGSSRSEGNCSPSSWTYNSSSSTSDSSSSSWDYGSSYSSRDDDEPRTREKEKGIKLDNGDIVEKDTLTGYYRSVDPITNNYYEKEGDDYIER